MVGINVCSIHETTRWAWEWRRRSRSRRPGSSSRTAIRSSDGSTGRHGGCPTVELINVHLTNPISTPLLVSLRRMRTPGGGSARGPARQRVTTVSPGSSSATSTHLRAWPLYRRSGSACDRRGGASGHGDAAPGATSATHHGCCVSTTSSYRAGFAAPVPGWCKLVGADHRGLVIDLEPGAPAG